jgi:hypothetical protein
MDEIVIHDGGMWLGWGFFKYKKGFFSASTILLIIFLQLLAYIKE